MYGFFLPMYKMNHQKKLVIEDPMEGTVRILSSNLVIAVISDMISMITLYLAENTLSTYFIHPIYSLYILSIRYKLIFKENLVGIIVEVDNQMYTRLGRDNR